MEIRLRKIIFGKLSETLLVLFTLWMISACAFLVPPTPNETETNLRDFALANCFSGYLQKKDQDVTDIQGISGGYLETGDSQLEVYMEIADTVEAWKPDIRSKQDMDIDLVKCFHLDENEKLEALIEDAVKG